MIDAAHFLHALRRESDLVAHAPAVGGIEPLHVRRLYRVRAIQIGRAVVARKGHDLALAGMVAHQGCRRFFCSEGHFSSSGDMISASLYPCEKQALTTEDAEDAEDTEEKQKRGRTG